MATKRSLKRTLALTAGLTTACAVSGSLATDPKSEWYQALEKPPWQPPGWLFPVAWTALYSSVAITSAKTIVSLTADGRQKDAGRYRAALVANLVLNQSWSWVFFKAHRLRSATVVAALLAASSADLARRSGSAGCGKALALTPYAAWCSFATILTGEILRRNPPD